MAEQLPSSISEQSDKPEEFSSIQNETPENSTGVTDTDDLDSTKEEVQAEQNAGENEKKSVTFPDGDDIILAYHEHPSPWHPASDCSPEGLVAAYKEACGKFEVKPMPKLLQQLHAIGNFEERNETLTLRSERLDAKNCETIEEVLRRVQFRTIDLEATHLDDESAIALFDMIEYYHSATRVNISYNKLGVRGWQSCSRMLKRTPCIEQLDARCCTIVDQVMPLFGRAIRLGSQLVVLHLENSVASGRPLMILVAAIKMNEPLRELYLADNKLMPTDGIQLGNLLKFNHKLRLLDVRNNHLGDIGCGHVFDGLCEQTFGAGLQTLVLWNNQMSYQVMHSLSRALRLTQSLETINLGHNNITNEGVHRMKEAILFNKTLLRIGLQTAKITCEGAVALAECIAESTKLLRLDLRENDIKTGGLMALSLALKVNTSVTRIDLDQKPKKESSVRDYAVQQQRLLSDIAVHSQRNRTASLQRDEEERQRRVEQELKRAMQEDDDTTCHSDEDEIEEGVAVEADTEHNADTNSQSHLSLTDQSNNSAAVNAVSTSNSKESNDLPSQTNDSNEETNSTSMEGNVTSDAALTQSPSPFKLDLNLPVMSRSATLESPVETTPPIGLGSVSVPETLHEESANSMHCTQSDISPVAVLDLPPSPMVSSEGKSILAAALAESEGIERNKPEISQANIADGENKNISAIPDITVPPSSSPPLAINIPTPQSIIQTEIPRSPSPRLSPSTRKFTISRVLEKPRKKMPNLPVPSQETYASPSNLNASPSAKTVNNSSALEKKVIDVVDNKTPNKGLPSHPAELQDADINTGYGPVASGCSSVEDNDVIEQSKEKHDNFQVDSNSTAVTTQANSNQNEPSDCLEKDADKQSTDPNSSDMQLEEKLGNVSTNNEVEVKSEYSLSENISSLEKPNATPELNISELSMNNVNSSSTLSNSVDITSQEEESITSEVTPENDNKPLVEEFEATVKKAKPDQRSHDSAFYDDNGLCKDEEEEGNSESSNTSGSSFEENEFQKPSNLGNESEGDQISVDLNRELEPNLSTSHEMTNENKVIAKDGLKNMTDQGVLSLNGINVELDRVEDTEETREDTTIENDDGAVDVIDDFEKELNEMLDVAFSGSD